MRVETLEYGDDPESEYPEDWNSFKVFTVWSEPGIVTEPDGGPVGNRDDDMPDNEKRLATAVELSWSTGSYLFIERSEPTPKWITEVFELLEEEGWEGHYLNEIRVDCRGEIEIEEKEDWTAVIDRKNEKVFHNREMRKGNSKVEDLEEFRSN